jgi:hypothetical protein
VISGDPKPLNKKAKIQGFVPDTTQSWVVVYAAPCPTCEGGDSHDRFYIVPMIGWLDTDNNGFELRPAVMIADGTVNDYLGLPDNFKFVAVLQDDPTTVDIARAIYRGKYGGELLEDEPAVDWLPN